MLGIYFWIGLSILNISLSARALARCVREQFRPGITAGVVRGGAAVLAFWLGLRMHFWGMENPPPWVGLALCALLLVMPFASGTALLLAHRRRLGVPAAEEMAASRPFDAWLPAGIVDAILVVIGLFAFLMSGSS